MASEIQAGQRVEPLESESGNDSRSVVRRTGPPAKSGGVTGNCFALTVVSRIGADLPSRPDPTAAHPHLRTLPRCRAQSACAPPVKRYQQCVRSMLLRQVATAT